MLHEQFWFIPAEPIKSIVYYNILETIAKSETKKSSLYTEVTQ